MQVPALPFGQSVKAASLAASRSLREAAPTYFPVSVVARAPHMALPARRMILHPLAPHSLNATSSARAGEPWFQLQPRLPVFSSHAMAP